MPGCGDTCSHFMLALCFCLLLAVCVKGQCRLPKLKVGLVMIDEIAVIDEFREGTSIVLHCARGYSRKFVSGSSSRIRCENGQWTNQTLHCQLYSCGSPGEILNGKFDTPNGVEFGAIARASCNPGYKLIGTGKRQCFDFGWNNLIPVCESVKCKDPPTISNGAITSIPNGEFYTFSEVVTYACNDKKYTLLGDASLTCNEHGEYSGTVPHCKEVTCPTPDVKNGFKVEGGPPPYKYKYSVTYQCDNGFVMNGSSRLVCGENGWSAPIPTCVKGVKCKDPPTISNGIITSIPNGEFYKFFEVVTYACNDKKYTLLGDASLTCNEHGEYSGTVPQCKEVTCPTPDVKNGFRVEGGPPPYKYQYSVTYQCDDDFVMNGSSRLVCGENGWSAPIPACVKTPPVTKPTTTTTTATAGTPTMTKPVTTNLAWLYAILGIAAVVVLGLGGYCGYNHAKSKRKWCSDKTPHHRLTQLA